MNDDGYAAVATPQWLVFGCWSLLAAILFAVAPYPFIQSSRARRLEGAGVHTQALVVATEAEHATVTFVTEDRDEVRVRIDRVGDRLCPDPGALAQNEVCGQVPEGLVLPVVYDRDDPTVVLPADAAAAGSWSAAGLGLVGAGVVMVLLAAGRIRWIRRLGSLRSELAPRTAATVTRFRHRASKSVVRGPVVAPAAAIVLRPADGTSGSISLALAPNDRIDDLAEGVHVTAIGKPEPGGAVAVEFAGTLLWPMRKARRAR